MKNERQRSGGMARDIGRVFLRTIDHALAQLRDRRPAQHARCIHEARKDIKKLRALMRLVRTGIPPAARRRENDRLRNLGRKLAPQRDAAALREMLAKLRADHHRSSNLDGALTKLAGVLARRDRRLTAARPALLSPSAVGVLERLRARVAAWPWRQINRADLRAGMRRTYRAGRREFQKCARSPSPADLHRWRKRVKDLWYQMGAVGPVSSKAAAKTLRRLRKIGEGAGADHDLALLTLLAQPVSLTARERHALERLLAIRRARLQKITLRLGQDSYSAKPRSFVRRI